MAGHILCHLDRSQKRARDSFSQLVVPQSIKYEFCLMYIIMSLVLGGSGGMLPQKILKSRGLEMLFPEFSKSYLLFTHIANYLQTNAH